jgi:predicted nucleotidyltransferase
MLEKLFKSRTTTRVLNLLLFDRPLHIREIARRVGITPIYVKKELENLEKLGLVKNTRVGNLSIWGINKFSPIYDDIKRIFLKTESLGVHLRNTLKNKDVRYAFVYGSFAKGSEKEGSDIDLFIVGEISDEKLAKLVSKAEKGINREINYIHWTGKEFEKNASKAHHLLADIVKNPVIWIHGDEHEFRKVIRKRND